MSQDQKEITPADETGGNHTPGPWVAKIARLAPDAEPFGFTVVHADRKHSIANVGVYEQTTIVLPPEWRDSNAAKNEWVGHYYTPEELVANAKLIAAAPETAAERDRLKEALQTLRPFVSSEYAKTVIESALSCTAPTQSEKLREEVADLEALVVTMAKALDRAHQDIRGISGHTLDMTGRIDHVFENNRAAIQKARGQA